MGRTSIRPFQRLALLVLVGLLAAACSSTPAGKAGSGGASPSHPGPSPSPVALQSVDWAAVSVGLLDCASPGLSSPPAADVAQVSYVDPDSTHHLAVVLSSCAAGAGAPPAALYVFDRASSTTDAHLLQTLLPPTLDRLAQSFSVTPTASAEASPVLSGQTITLPEAAYSSAAVADCCPDLMYPVTWTWSGSSYTGSPADRAAAYPITATVTPPEVSAAIGDRVSFVVAVSNSGSAPARSMSVFVVSTAPAPCAPGDDCPDNGLKWVSGTPGCRYSATTTSATCSIGTLAPGASATTTVTMEVAEAAGPLAFQPEVDGQISGGRFLPSLPTATVTVTG